MELIIVADTRDLLASAVAEEARARGAQAIVIDHGNAARLFTIATSGNSVRVTPEVPILLRHRERALQDVSGDARFLSNEADAALWAATALTESIVVNRPTMHGWEASWTPSGAILERRAGLSPELELHSCPDRPASRPEGRPWAYAGPSGLPRRWLSSRPAQQAFRARPLLDREVYAVVAVVGDHSWYSHDKAPEIGLREQSTSVVHRLGLTFALVTWGISQNGETRLARVEPYPQLNQVAYIWPKVVDALLGVLKC